MSLGPNGPAPYAPARTITALIEQYRDKGLPEPVTTATLVRAGVEDSLAPRTLQALKILDLVNEKGELSETMKAIGVATTQDLPAVLAGWLQAAYREIFAFVNADDDVQRITDQFRHYDPKGMRNRMVTLFLGLCAKAELISELPKMPRASKGAATSRTNSSSSSTKPTTTKSTAKPEKPTGAKPPEMKPIDESNARQRYIDMLLTRAADAPELDFDLLDRIERALGIAGGASS